MAVTFRDKHRGPQKLSMSRPRRCRILTHAHPASVSLTSTSWTRPFGQLLGLAVGIRWRTSVSSSLLQIGHCVHIRARASSSWSTSAWPGRLLLAMDLATCCSSSLADGLRCCLGRGIHTAMLPAGLKSEAFPCTPVNTCTLRACRRMNLSHVSAPGGRVENRNTDTHQLRSASWTRE